MRKTKLLLALSYVIASGCMTLHAVNPRPNIVVPSSSAKYALEIGAEVPDVQKLRGIDVVDFHQTLKNGFKNAAGSRFSEAKDGNYRLVIDLATIEIANLGDIGRFLTIRYRGRWLGPDGAQLAEFAGVAQPRNPTETGPRHLEDVVEVLYEQSVDGLAKTRSGDAGGHQPRL